MRRTEAKQRQCEREIEFENKPSRGAGRMRVLVRVARGIGSASAAATACRCSPLRRVHAAGPVSTNELTETNRCRPRCGPVRPTASAQLAQFRDAAGVDPLGDEDVAGGVEAGVRRVVKFSRLPVGALFAAAQRVVLARDLLAPRGSSPRWAMTLSSRSSNVTRALRSGSSMTSPRVATWGEVRRVPGCGGLSDRAEAPDAVRWSLCADCKVQREIPGDLRCGPPSPGEFN